jgi:hypothetical protein
MSTSHTNISLKLHFQLYFIQNNNLKLAGKRDRVINKDIKNYYETKSFSNRSI